MYYGLICRFCGILIGAAGHRRAVQDSSSFNVLEKEKPSSRRL